MIDLDAGVRPLALEKLNRRRLARIIVDAIPMRVDSKNHKFPSPDQLRDEAIRLRAEGRAKESHYVSRMARDVRLMIRLANKMSHSMKASPA